MKYLLVLLVVAVGLWLLLGRSRRPPVDRRRKDGEPDVMVRCDHCGVHLPAADAVTDDVGRTFCSDAHRLAGPR